MKAASCETVRRWIMATRPKTLVASLIPVFAGASLAFGSTGKLPWLLLGLAALFSLLIQIGTNFSNDYFDDLRGADRNRTLGPARSVSSGSISGKTMIRASLIVLLSAFVTGVVLMEVSGASRQLLWVGALSVIFALGYTGGPFPLAYVGLGGFSSYCFLGSLRFAALTMSLSSESEDNGSPIGSRRRASGLSSTTCSLSTTRGTAWRTNWSVSGPWWSCAVGNSAFPFMP